MFKVPGFNLVDDTFNNTNSIVFFHQRLDELSEIDKISSTATIKYPGCLSSSPSLVCIGRLTAFKIKIKVKRAGF